MPPEMHWALVMILSWITCGLAAVVWSFRQASFVRRIDPSSGARTQLTIAVVVMVLQVFVYFSTFSSMPTEAAAGAAVLLILLLNIAIVVLMLMAFFAMRRSMVRYYNTTEPIGLQLSGPMTFFFSVLYLQYHLSRIAEWKRTGRR